jgi:hypothetical protein
MFTRNFWEQPEAATIGQLSVVIRSQDTLIAPIRSGGKLSGTHGLRRADFLVLWGWCTVRRHSCYAARAVRHG